MGKDKYSRYHRQILLPELGKEGQDRICRSKILIIGAGGLGSPAALYLAAAGIGELGIVDDDTVDITNLQRQIMYDTEDSGEIKVNAASVRLGKLNPGVKIKGINERINEKNAGKIIKCYDIIIDGTDNYETRYIINKFSLKWNKPYIYASVYKYEGQISVFNYRKGPCYQCMYPEIPEEDSVPKASEVGILGPLPGIAGSIQAAEAIKIILENKNVMSGRILLIDMLKMDFRTLNIEKNAACPGCGNTKK
ncbi:MAG: HesA/MoeB/ThiF family protein [bacterium]|nr:HesA/MoeB/ThiF family protein [bacterium]